MPYTPAPGYGAPEQRNPYGYGTNEYWEFEAKRRGFKNPQEMCQEDYKNAPRCPYCGTPAGFAPGTGDCGCEPNVDVGW